MVTRGSRVASSPIVAASPTTPCAPTTARWPIVARAPTTANAPMLADVATTAVASTHAVECTPGNGSAAGCRIAATRAYVAYGLVDTSLGSGVSAAATGATMTADARVAASCAR